MINDVLLAGYHRLLEYVGIVLFAIVVMWLQRLSYRRWRHRRFKKREELSLEELYQQYFSGTEVAKDRFTVLWTYAAGVLELPASRLRPSDRFEKELKFGLIRRDPELHCFKSRMFLMLPAGHTKSDLRKLRTLRDYVEFFGQP